MATDIWNGNGDWTGTPADWSTGAPPGSGDEAVIQTGGDTLSTTASVKSVTVIANAQLALASAATLSTIGDLVDNGTLNVTGNGDTVHIGGVLTTNGYTTIGTTNLGAATTVTAAGFQTSGHFVLLGNAALTTSNQATLNVTGASSALVTGSVRVLGDADLELQTGLTAVALGGYLQVDGANARISLGSGTSSTALSGLASNAGTINFGGNSNLGSGGTSVTTSTSFNNNGLLSIDVDGGDVGSSITFGGSLTNSGTAQIGNTSLGTSGSGAQSTTVTATSLLNSDTLTLQGSDIANATNQATLNITGASSATATGTMAVAGDADLALATGLTAIGNGATLEIDGAQARVSLGLGTGNTGLSGLASNAGTLRLRGGTGFGNGGTTVTTSTAFANTATVEIDNYQLGEGGSTLNIGGVLTNAGTFLVGNTGLSASTTVTATGLSNAGSLYVYGNNSGASGNLATLSITGAGSATAMGSTVVGGDADLALTTGLTAVGSGATLEIDGQQARVSLGVGAGNSGLAGLTSNAGTLRLRGGTGNGAGGTSVTTSTGFLNTATTQVDGYQYGEGGSKLTIGGALTNAGTFVIGNAGLAASTTVTVSGLANAGSLSVLGNGAATTSNVATLSITGATSATATGYTLVGGNADLALTTAITGVASGATLEVDGQLARVSLGTGTTNTALTGIAGNDGIFRLRGDTGNGVGGTSVTTTTAFRNTATMQIDAYGNGDGGSTLTVGGKLTNTGTLGIGNSYLGAATSVTATGLNNTGTLDLVGGNGTNAALATLRITGTTLGTTTGFLLVGGNADLALTSAITGVGANATIEIDAALARISIGAGSGNSALTTLSSNVGTFRLRGDTGFGYGGTTVSTTKSFNNTGTTQIDSYGNGDGGSTFAIANKLTNAGSFTIGNNYLSASTTVTAGSLNNTGYLSVVGNNATGSSNLATLSVAGASDATTSGFMLVGGDADLALNNAITAVGASATLEIDSAAARVSLGTGTTNSALTGLSSNAGTFRLRGNTGFGGSGTTVTTSSGFSNIGTAQIDSYGNGDGGSTFNIGGTLANAGSFSIGNSYLSLATTVTATGLNDTGSLTLLGNNGSATTPTTTLDITGSNPGTLTGSILLGGNADLALATAVTAIGAQSTLEMDGGLTRLSLGTGTGDSALTGLASNAGTLRLRGDTGLGGGGTSITTTKLFNNTGLLQLDNTGNGDGGSVLAIGNSLTNSGTIDLGNYYASAATTLSAGSLANSGTLYLNDNSTTHLDEVTIAGATSNTGSLYIGMGAELAVGGGKAFSQQGGTTTVVGLLAASSVVDSGGVLDFRSALTAGNGTGGIQVSGGATLQFDAAVDSSHVVTFSGSSGGTLKLTTPANFAGQIAGFAGSDAIDLVNTSVTGLAYAGTGSSGTLTVSGASGTAATLAFQGSYTTGNFTAVSDGNGGTLILDPATKTA